MTLKEAKEMYDSLKYDYEQYDEAVRSLKTPEEVRNWRLDLKGKQPKGVLDDWLDEFWNARRRYEAHAAVYAKLYDEAPQTELDALSDPTPPSLPG